MTIAICLQVGDGVVLGSDSASSLIGEGERFHHVYRGAEKTFPLGRRLPLAMTVYGLGALLGRSIASHARDLRRRLEGRSAAHASWALDPATYTVRYAADLVRRFYYDELYRSEFGPPSATGAFPPMGILVAGFGAKREFAEVWEIEIGAGGQCEGPALRLNRERAGRLVYRGERDALDRLLHGWSSEVYTGLRKMGWDEARAMSVLGKPVELAHPTMPLADGVGLVHYLLEVTRGFVQYRAGPPTVDRPWAIAIITAHGGFRWACRPDRVTHRGRKVTHG